jgi:PPK2 family polyphosphate:nucleotide phosphotransferase
MQLSKISTRAPKSFDKEKTKLQTTILVDEISELQNILYAQGKYKVLIILQGMDASGKDGAIKAVFKGINPLGCSVKAFKAPNTEEQGYDFLWRIHKNVPEKGMIKIFNRSQYEDILVPTVHKLLPAEIIEKRYKHINQFEEFLVDNDTIILKYYLHISKEEQTQRLQERLTDYKKFWKHNDQDEKEAKLWNNYMKVYERIFKDCNKAAPWQIIPADQNWYKEFLIAKSIVESLKGLKLSYNKK